jgi:glutamate dehydrogenase/leucine dehydrogenase
LESATKFLLANTDSGGGKGSGQVMSQKLRPYATAEMRQSLLSTSNALIPRSCR